MNISKADSKNIVRGSNLDFIAPLKTKKHPPKQRMSKIVFYLSKENIVLIFRRYTHIILRSNRQQFFFHFV